METSITERKVALTRRSDLENDGNLLLPSFLLRFCAGIRETVNR
jgi:hypothetical protein